MHNLKITATRMEWLVAAIMSNGHVQVKPELDTKMSFMMTRAQPENIEAASDPWIRAGFLDANAIQVEASHLAVQVVQLPCMAGGSTI